ncbi:MAG TPA: gamma-glutamyltransferase, partial [Chloroflexota bacterium]|jgi:gamma-glutamyltranspeptidase/glutathione hydrolase
MIDRDRFDAQIHEAMAHLYDFPFLEYSLVAERLGLRDVQEAIEAPRAASYSAPSSFWPHQAEPGLVRAESRLGAEVLAGLRQRGHTVVEWPAWIAEAGSVCAVQFGENGVLRGGADPRREAYAIGW